MLAGPGRKQQEMGVIQWDAKRCPEHMEYSKTWKADDGAEGGLDTQ